jgi:hypothetical protein
MQMIQKKKTSSSNLRLPADATSASRTDGLGVIYDTERAADKLCGEINRRTSQEGERYRVDDDAGLSHDRVLKHTVGKFLRMKRNGMMTNRDVLVLGSAFPRELHPILISVATTRFDGDPQGRTRMFFLRRYSTELLHDIHEHINETVAPSEAELRRTSAARSVRTNCVSLSGGSSTSSSAASMSSTVGERRRTAGVVEGVGAGEALCGCAETNGLRVVDLSDDDDDDDGNESEYAFGAMN